MAMPGLLPNPYRTVRSSQLQESMGLTWGLHTLNHPLKATAILAEHSLKTGLSSTVSTGRQANYGAPDVKS